MGVSDVTVKRRIAGQLAGVGAITLVISGTAVAGPTGGGGWAEASTGKVSVMSVAQPSPSRTWAGGAAIDENPEDGTIRFTPAMYERDLARGGAWKQTVLPGADAWNSRINDISTAPDGSAFFVGDQGTNSQGVLVGRHVAGAWQLTSSTGLPDGTVEASLLSVSAASGQDAWAVGQGYTQDTYEHIPVVQHWDGRRWRSVQIPGSANWGLNQVEEVAPNDVWITGMDYDTGQSLAVHWDGRQWTRTPTPVFPDSAVLFDIAARTPTDVWAVGWSRDTDKQRPAGLALHWDGTSWTQVPLPVGTFSFQAITLRPHGGLAVVGGNDDAAVGLTWTPAAGWRSLDLPENDPQFPLGVSSVVSSGTHLTVGGWHYLVDDDGDSFMSGAILTR
ncbi:hypothetical protein OG864_48680 [Streptomyces sp. NBC_00124]|uniref:hypothetical protein n=1 Tax=Streptomyces sp. NBC_00124 TaxID=2975662 RepID=UPI00225C40EE|nr:hypothetical protein [Streptomyces sp. NBC_00124]MCX5366580.1 hypothetical protein [Streptomyces sp. NBC_00124]